MSSSLWCDLNKDTSFLMLQEQGVKSKFNCQKQVNFTAKQFQLEDAGFTSKMDKNFTATQSSRKILQRLMKKLPILVWLLVPNQEIQRLVRLLQIVQNL